MGWKDHYDWKENGKTALDFENVKMEILKIVKANFGQSWKCTGIRKNDKTAESFENVKWKFLKK